MHTTNTTKQSFHYPKCKRYINDVHLRDAPLQPCSAYTGQTNAYTRTHNEKPSEPPSLQYTNTPGGVHLWSPYDCSNCSNCPHTHVHAATCAYTFIHCIPHIANAYRYIRLNTTTQYNRSHVARSLARSLCVYRVYMGNKLLSSAIQKKRQKNITKRKI